MITTVSVVIPVYRDSHRALAAINTVINQALPLSTNLEIIVVDDGSKDESVRVLEEVKCIKLLQLPENRGRAAARNAGALMAEGQAVVFMDCDCLAIGKQFLASHLHSLQRGAIASTGHVIGIDGGFWDLYQRKASVRREAQHRGGSTWTGSTQNFAVLKDAFEHVGGFDTRYQRYGFEDRDLLIRLSSVGEIAWTNEAVVQHTDEIHMQDVANKMAEGAIYSGGLFAAQYPEAYRTLGYAAVDARLHPWLHPIGKTLGSMAMNQASHFDRWLAKLPFGIAAAIAKSVSALAYLHGSTLISRTQESDPSLHS